MSTKKYFDLSAYNQTSDWKRIELPFRRVAEEPETYILATIGITIVAIPLNLFIILQILRFSQRRTAINGLIVSSSFCALAALSHLVLILINSNLFCASVFLFFPSFMLFHKLLLTSMATVRHMYVLCKSLIYGNNAGFMFIVTFFSAFVIASIPLLTLIHEQNPLMSTCLLDHDQDAKEEYAFLLAYFIILSNSLLVDVICYSRILNYMRKNSVRVSVIASSPIERSKGAFINLVDIKMVKK